MPRAVLWCLGALAVLLYTWVAIFGFVTLGPELGCFPGPEVRFWGYGIAAFDDCFAPTPPAITAEYIAVLRGLDRLLAVALTLFLAMWSVHLTAWVGVVAALGYGLSDWFENGALVAALNGDPNAIGTASALTMAKFATLTVACFTCFRASRQQRRMT